MFLDILDSFCSTSSWQGWQSQTADVCSNAGVLHRLLPSIGGKQANLHVQGRPATSSSKLWCCQAGTEVKPNIQKMLVAFNCRHGSQDPYASGFAEAPFLLRRLKHTNIGAPSAGGRAHCSQKHRRVLTMEHSLPPSIGVVNFVPPLMHSSFTWTANKGRPLACGAEKPRPMQKM